MARSESAGEVALLLVGVVGDAASSLEEAEGTGAVEMVEIGGGGTIPPKRPSKGFLDGPSMADVAGEEEEKAVGRFGSDPRP